MEKENKQLLKLAEKLIKFDRINSFNVSSFCQVKQDIDKLIDSNDDFKLCNLIFEYRNSEWHDGTEQSIKKFQTARDKLAVFLLNKQK